MEFWSFVLHLGFGILSFIVGVIGFSQIIGSIRTIRIRGIAISSCTIGLWVVILGVFLAIVFFFIPSYKTSFLIGMALSILMSLGSGKNGVK